MSLGDVREVVNTEEDMDCRHGQDLQTMAKGSRALPLPPSCFSFLLVAVLI